MLGLAELTELLCEHAGLSGQEAKAMVRAFFDVMRDALESGENVKLSGFGNFQVREKTQRLSGVNYNRRRVASRNDVTPG